MNRFYFHAHVCGGYLEDRIGIELADVAEAYGFALQNVRGLVTSYDDEGSSFDLAGWIEVEDETGSVLATVPFAEALEADATRH